MQVPSISRELAVGQGEVYLNRNRQYYLIDDERVYYLQKVSVSIQKSKALSS